MAVRIKDPNYPAQAPNGIDPEMYERLKAEMMAKIQGYNMPGYQPDAYAQYDEMTPPWLRQNQSFAR